MKKENNIKIIKKHLTKPILNQIIEIDKEFYKDFDYSETDWYFQRYNNENTATVLLVNDKIVGYFLFINISKKLFNEIIGLKYDGDYNFPHKEVNVPSNYYYMPSLLVKQEYRNFSLPLIIKLKQEISKKDNLAVIGISKEGKSLARLVLKEVGNCKNSTIYCKIKQK